MATALLSWHDVRMPVAGVRERARAEVMSQILASAHRQLAEVGPGELSLRAVAREIGMVSSAIYRYVASRDELLTLLIIDAYNDLGAAAERAESVVDRADLLGRWLAITHSARDWALNHPNDYALIFGSPVPGYAAPQDTIGPASRIPRLMTAVLAQAKARTGSAAPPARSARPASPSAQASLAPVLATMAEDPAFAELAVGSSSSGGHPSPDRDSVVAALSADAMAVGILVWTHLLGSLSAELFGHRHNVVADDGRRAFFDYEMRVMADLVGLPASEGSG